jgi:hypothetical protein
MRIIGSNYDRYQTLEPGCQADAGGGAVFVAGVAGNRCNIVGVMATRRWCRCGQRSRAHANAVIPHVLSIGTQETDPLAAASEAIQQSLKRSNTVTSGASAICTLGQRLTIAICRDRVGLGKLPSALDQHRPGFQLLTCAIAPSAFVADIDAVCQRHRSPHCTLDCLAASAANEHARAGHSGCLHSALHGLSCLY